MGSKLINFKISMYSEYVFLISRLILGFFFLFNSYNHFRNLKTLSQYFKSKNIILPKFSVIFMGILLLIGGLSILFGIYVEVGVLALTLFFLPVTFIVHSFWKESDPQERMVDITNFMKNMAIWAGVLSLLYVPKPWSFSLFY